MYSSNALDMLTLPNVTRNRHNIRPVTTWFSAGYAFSSVSLRPTVDIRVLITCLEKTCMQANQRRKQYIMYKSFVHQDGDSNENAKQVTE